MIVLDTNVLSELMRDASAHPRVTGFVQTTPRRLATTVISHAEIRAGIALLPSGRRRTELSSAASRVLDATHTLSLDIQSAGKYASIVAHRREIGRPIAALDAFIAAIALANDAAIATRNTKDFEGLGIELIDPWAWT